MRNTLRRLGFKFGPAAREPRSKLFSDILTVLARVAQIGKVNYDEIKPYLDELKGGEKNSK